MFQATFVARVESCSIPCDLSHGTKISANTYDTLRNLSHVSCCMRQNRIVYTHVNVHTTHNNIYMYIGRILHSSMVSVGLAQAPPNN